MCLQIKNIFTPPKIVPLKNEILFEGIAAMMLIYSIAGFHNSWESPGLRVLEANLCTA